MELSWDNGRNAGTSNNVEEKTGGERRRIKKTEEEPDVRKEVLDMDGHFERHDGEGQEVSSEPLQKREKRKHQGREKEKGFR